MIDEMANHATRIRRYQERYGVERVEQFAALELTLVGDAPRDDPLDAVTPFLAACPTPVHRAYLELLLAAWVARTHDVAMSPARVAVMMRQLFGEPPPIADSKAFRRL